MSKIYSSHTHFIKQTAQTLGFEYCGISKAVYLEDDARRLENWLNNNYHGSMSYMANHFDLRVDPSKLVAGAKSVITLLYNYFPENQQIYSDAKISKYAYGADYHDVIRNKLRLLVTMLQDEIGDIEGRGFVDSAPVLERTWAQKSGLGWIGKNGNLINKQQGSFFFIATLIIDIDLEYDNPLTKDFCGTCNKCIEACPTEAILSPTIIDAKKCISYLTIELKDEFVPKEFEGKADGWMFGCDVCQDVCPWNRFSKPHHKEELTPIQNILTFSLDDWKSLEEDTFKTLLKHSPIKRAKYKGLQKNIRFVSP